MFGLISKEGEWAYFTWASFVGLVTAVVAILHPLVVVFPEPLGVELRQWDYFCFGVFLADAALGFFPNPLRRPPSRNPSIRISSHAIDLMVLLPFGWFALSNTHSLWLLLPVIKLFALNKVYLAWSRQMDMNPIVLRISVFGCWVLVLAHWAACGWVVLESVGDVGKFSSSAYIRALYWSITTLTTVGYGDVSPQTDSLRIYTMVIMIFGVGVYGFVIGNMASVFANRDLAHTAFRNRVDNVMAYLRYQDIPKKLQKKARQYFEYVWATRVGHQDEGVLQELPHSVRNDVLVHLHRTLVHNVPFFKRAGEDFLLALIPRLKLDVWVPGEPIFRAGDCGDQMYFVSRGEVDVYSPEHELLTTLSDGDFFGEVALIETETRQASVSARTYCTTCALSRKDLDILLKDSPEFAEMLHESIRSYQ